MNTTWAKRLLPLPIFAFGVVGMLGLSSLASTAERGAPESTALAVRVLEVSQAVQPARVEATGTTQAARMVSLVPQVAGPVVDVSPKLMPGGRFDEGEVLARIDATPYKAAKAAAEATLAKAELALKLEEGRVQTAQREWQLLGKEGTSPDLAARKLHLAAALADVEAARTALDKAKEDLGRTALRAPFAAIVTSESLELGQVVASSPVATLVGTDALWVPVAIPVERIADLEVPGSRARVTHELGNVDVERWGEVLQVNGTLDAATRTASVLVRVDQPFEGELPLLPGALVTVVIEGKPVADATSIPRSTLHRGDTVWVADGGVLAARTVTALWGDTETVAVRGLQNGDQVVTSHLALPIDGTRVEIVK